MTKKEKAEPRLTPEQREELAALVTKTRTEIEELLSSSRDDSKPVDLGLAIGRLSRVDALQQQEMAAARRRRMETRLEQLRGALGRIANGTYGECLSCGGSIGYARLAIRPEALRCKDCQAGD